MNDPLIDLLKRVRKAHGMSQSYVELRMGLPHGTYRHIERGRRPLPDIRHGLVDWIRSFEIAVGATPEERKEILVELSRVILNELSGLLEDVENDVQ